MLDTNYFLISDNEDVLTDIEFIIPMDNDDLFSEQQLDTVQIITFAIEMSFTYRDDLFSIEDLLELSISLHKMEEKKLSRKKVVRKRTLTVDSENGRKLMSIYMESASRFGLLTIAEEVDLVTKMKNGDTTARERLIKCNLRLVVKISHDFKGKGLPIEDLVQEGNIGLIRAIDKYELGHGAKISSYAAWWIKQSMRRAIANQSRTIRIPVQSCTKLIRIRSSEEKLRCKLNREPTNREIVDETKLSIKTVEHLRNKNTTVVSLDDPIGDDANFTHANTIQAKSEDMDQKELIAELYDAIEQLPPVDQFVIRERFGLEDGERKTLNEISLKMDRTRERVRQIQCSAVNKLKGLLKDYEY